jgi:hypothetical protein
MLEQRAEALVQTCRTMQERQKTMLQVAALQTKAGQLRDLREKADQAAQVISLLWGRGDAAALHEAVDLAQRYPGLLARHAEMEQNPELLTGTDDEVYQEVHRQLRALAEGVLQHARDAWAAYKSEHVPGDQRDLLRAFSLSRPEVVERLGKLRARLREFGDLPDERSLALFDATVREYRSKFVELFGEETPGDVLEALQGATSPEGASLAEFDADVLAWLRERGIENAFRVKTL